MPIVVSKLIYEFPIPFDMVTEVVTENESHQGLYKGSVDFAVPLSTPVLAAADGMVTRIRDDSTKYGQGKSYGPEVNYVTIKHSGGELSEYLHLKRDSVLVQIGDTVMSGQQIAVTGLSGWLYAPHLHFMVHTLGKFQCMDVKFRQPLQKSF